MVGSSFIYTVCGKRRTLLNTAQIASVHVNDVDVNSELARRRYEEHDPLEGKIYLLTVAMASGQHSEYVYATADDRDKVYDEILAAPAPAVTIVDTSPDVPRKPKGLKPTSPDELTLDELRPLAMAQLKHLQKQAVLAAAMQATPPAPKPPRTPRAKKGEE